MTEQSPPSSDARIVVRTRTGDDMPACEAVLRQVHEIDNYPMEWQVDTPGWLTPQPFQGAWIALRDATLIGHVALADGEKPGTIEIARLFVDPAAQGSGAAKALMSVALAYAKSRSLLPVLDVLADRDTVIAFYERNGWRLTGNHISPWVLRNGDRPLVCQYEYVGGDS